MVEEIQIEIVGDKSQEPIYATLNSAGADLKANEDITIYGNETMLVDTGIKVAIPEGYEIQIRPRSGMALKNNVIISNSPGTLDSDFRGDVKIIIRNLIKTPFTINKGDRIAQMVVNKYYKAKWKFVEKLPETERGEGGFGSTGVK
jgi:dUTP pyrophosphatase